MASIGELTATVRADISGYVGPMKQVAQTTNAVVVSTKESSKAIEKVGHTAILVAGQFSGLEGHFGSLAAKLSMLAGGGGIMFAVSAAIAVIGYAFNRATEDIRKHNETIDDLVKSYQDATGASIRLRLEEAQAEMATVRRGRLKFLGLGAGNVPIVGRFSTTEEQTRATQALLQAQRDYAEHQKNVLAPGVQRATEALREQERVVREFANLLNQAEVVVVDPAVVKALDQQAQALSNVKREAIGALEAEKERRRITIEGAQAEIAKAKGSGGKDVMGRQEDAIQSARDMATQVSHAFVGAFADNQDTMIHRLGAIFTNIIRQAIEKALAAKLFDAFLGILTGGASKGISSDILGNIPIIGNLFGGAPAMSPGGSSTIVVPLSNLPAPLSPVDVARDQMHQMVWMETARVAEMNGFRIRLA